MRTALQHVECLHLVFLRLLESRLDRSTWVVKAGVNLRAWFGSLRYSEDLDIDAVRGSSHALREKVDKLLSSVTFGDMLAAQGLSADPRPLNPALTRATATALERVLALPFEAFRAQVVPFLAPEHQEVYGTPESWTSICGLVVDRLAELVE